MEQAILEQIGLTRSEINVYMALLELGSSATGKIIEKSKASSSKIYEILDRLMQKGLVSFVVKSRIKYFEAAAPKRLMDYLNQKEERLKEQKNEIKKIIPTLELKRKLLINKSEATIYKTIRGLETAFYSALNLLKSGETQYVIGLNQRDPAINRFFIKFQKERARRNIKMKAIVNESARNELRIQADNAPLSEIKYMPETTLTAINIFKNRTLIFPQSEEPLLIVIDSKEVAQSFKVQFDMWWNQDTKIVRGLDFIQNVFEEMLEAGHCDLIGARGYFVDLRPEYINDWEKRAIKKGFTMRNIVDPEIKGRRITQFPFVKTKYTLLKEFSNLSVFWIYGTKVVISNWMEKEPFAVSIDNKHLNDMYKQQFELLWNRKVSF